MHYQVIPIVGIVLSLLLPCPAWADDLRSVSVELFVGKDCPYSAKAAADLSKRPGLKITKYDVTQDGAALRKLYDLAETHGVKAGLPMLHALDRVIVGYSSDSSPASYDRVFEIDVFVRSGCPHCTAAKSFLRQLAPRYPGIRFVYHDIVNDQAARKEWERANAKHGIRMPGVPTFVIGRRLVVGYSSDATSGTSLRKMLDAYTVPAPSPRTTSMRENGIGPFWVVAATRSLGAPNPSASRAALLVALDEEDDVRSAPTDRSRPPPFPDTEEERHVTPPPPLPDEADPEDEEDLTAEATSVELPWIGLVDPEKVGMPLFTIALGLVDGFNPCAMWVLLFLLSILVNVKDRRKIFAVAGTFVFVSGAVYLAFMAAWLNVFHFIGLQRWSEILLGFVAVLIGLVHVKDFFAFKRGVSLSIPESAKPGIYARVRDVVTAKNVAGAIVGVAALAVLVNFVELLCTAGLPAVFTRVLTMREYPLWKEYSYLLLYIAAYMFDDSLMVAAAVVTLNKFKLQETGGRWLKLVSGCCILLLGLVLCFAPHLLV